MRSSWRVENGPSSTAGGVPVPASACFSPTVTCASGSTGRRLDAGLLLLPTGQRRRLRPRCQRGAGRVGQLLRPAEEPDRREVERPARPVAFGAAATAAGYPRRRGRRSPARRLPGCRRRPATCRLQTIPTPPGGKRDLRPDRATGHHGDLPTPLPFTLAEPTPRQTAGWRSHPPLDLSSCAAVAISLASSPYRPVSSTPTGSPSAVTPTGSETDGAPVTLNTAQYGENRRCRSKSSSGYAPR